ncbi:MAG: hypothetical protein SH850_07955 [Planctomycetaceae bacterium]|nr:hypothetical protein [Planctomycetaceae bacterium]
MVAKSTSPGVAVKPKKPRADFPLFPHASGRWAKKVRGRFAYFGKVADDPKGVKALAQWLEQRDELLAGQTPRVKGPGLTVRDLCNRFLTAKRTLIDSDELSRRTFTGYMQSTDKLIAAFGKHRLVTDLASDDFERLRADLAEGVGPVSLRNDVRMIRMVFKYGYDAGLIDKPIRFGPHFRIPPKRLLRQARQAAGKRMFEADELRSIIDAAGQPLKAMTLLAINCGCGNTDVANLPLTAVDLDAGWLDYPRPKTAVERRVPLWPETVAAMREALENRPRSTDGNPLCFLTKYRQCWVRVSDTGSIVDGVAGEFGKLLKRPRCPQCGVIAPAKRGEKPARCASCQWTPTDPSEWQTLHRNGLNFYAVRHTFQTIAEESRDLPAVRYIMGHADQSMSAEYRERFSDDRLLDVVGAVHCWLWPEAKLKASTKRAKAAARKRGP